MFPVRCYTCNSVLAHLYDTYSDRTSMGEEPLVLFKDLNVTSMCCRRMFLGHVDLTSNMVHHSRKDVVLDASKSELMKEVRFTRSVTTD